MSSSLRQFFRKYISSTLVVVGHHRPDLTELAKGQGFSQVYSYEKEIDLEDLSLVPGEITYWFRDESLDLLSLLEQVEVVAKPSIILVSHQRKSRDLLIDRILTINPEYSFSYSDKEDILVAMPPKPLPIVTDHISLLQYFIAKYHFRSYLEIGCENNECFNQIKVSKKAGVDPRSGGNVRQTSDAYFATLSEGVKFDLIFIDGLHHSEQVDRDIANSLRHLTVDGIIVIHDCKPTDPIVGSYPCESNGFWTGDVWKAVVAWRDRQDVDICVLDLDWGCGILLPRPNTEPIKQKIPILLTWDVFQTSCHWLLNLKNWEGVKDWLDKDGQLSKFRS